MVISTKRIFVYGHFLDGRQKAERSPLPIETSSVAIEVLREFSATELVGKIYVLVPGRSWQVAFPTESREYDWLRKYETSRRAKGGAADVLYFETREGDFWEVLYLRQESDESGPYLAAALRHQGKARARSRPPLPLPSGLRRRAM